MTGIRIVSLFRYAHARNQTRILDEKSAPAHLDRRLRGQTRSRTWGRSDASTDLRADRLNGTRVKGSFVGLFIQVFVIV